MYSYSVHLQCTPKVYTYSVHLKCTPIMYTYTVHLHCTPTVYTYSLNQQCTPYSIHCTVYTYSEHHTVLWADLAKARVCSTNTSGVCTAVSPQIFYPDKKIQCGTDPTDGALTINFPLTLLWGAYSHGIREYRIYEKIYNWYFLCHLWMLIKFWKQSSWIY